MFSSTNRIDYESKGRVSRGVLTATCALAVVLIVGLLSGGAFAQVSAEQKISQSQGGLTQLLGESDSFGRATGTIGDIDGNGVDEVAVGVPGDDYGGTDRGAVWITFLNTNGTVRARQKIAARLGGFRDFLDDGDGFGSSVAGIGDVDGDGVEDLLVGAPFDDDAMMTGSDLGAVWILFLNSDGTVRDFTKISDKTLGFAFNLQDGDHFGSSVCGLGDLDGDTVPDIVVGASGDDSPPFYTNRGAAYVMFLNPDGSLKSYVVVDFGAGALLHSEDYFGSSAAPVGDLDGNGFVDFVIGAPGDDDGASRAGAVWVLFADTVGGEWRFGAQKISATEGNFTGALDSGDEFGTAVTYMGDKDGDGNEDIMVGSPGDDDGGSGRGAAWLLLLGDNGTVLENYKISDTAGDFPGTLDDNDNFGAALTRMRYWMGETPHELVVVGAPNDDDSQTDSGAAWVLSLTPLGAVTYTQKVSQTEGEFSALIDDWVRFGNSLAPIGDLNDDGVGDMVAGDMDNDDSFRGAVWVLFMNTDGTVKAHQKIGWKAGGFTGVLDEMDEFGHGAAGLGDLDNDGVEDIAVGAPLDDAGGTDRGAVWILFLNPDGTAKGQQKIADHVGGFEGTLTEFGQFGVSLTGLGDINGDGLYELAVGAPYDSELGIERGAVWLLSLLSDGTVDSAPKINDAHGGFTGVLDNQDHFGYSVTGLGDIDGNGVGEIAVGAVSDDDGGTDRGAVWILYMKADRTVRGQTKISSTEGAFAGALDDGDRFGHSVASNGDMDGDGIGDLFVGAAYDDDGGTDRGTVWVIFMSPAGTVKSYGKISATEGNFPGPLADGVLFGASVAPLGDVNGDGVADIGVGAVADNDGGEYAGAVWLLNLTQPDPDGDGVYYTADSCPAQDASFFDRDGDGCVDEPAGARHIEYWGEGETLAYRIQQDGAPNIGDGSDFTAIQQAVDTWTAIVGVDMNSLYVGTTAMETAVAGDGINLVTFRDFDYDFGTHTLAVGVATSFTEPTWLDGKLYRAGQIVDADMMFNPAKTFTTSGGSGVDLQSVTTHEAGHLYGISHSAAKGSVMFYALQQGTGGRLHKVEDVTISQKAYPDPAWLATARQVIGHVVDLDGDPVPGAIVFLTSATNGDTLGCDFTLPDGSFRFVTMPPVISVYLSIYPCNGTSPIGYLETDYVNALVDSTAITTFPAEYFNLGDSFDEDAALKTIINIPLAGVYGPYEIMTNQDVAGPTVLSHSPAHGATAVGVDAAVVVEFSEAIDYKTVKGNFRLQNMLAGTGTAGNAIITSDDHILAFKSTSPLKYETLYECTLRTGITDLYANHLGAPYVFQFTTETEPPVALNSVVPNKGVVGSIVVLNGAGFDTAPAGNTVRFTDAAGTGTLVAPVLNASPLQLVVEVPAGAGTGNVNVDVGGFVSNGESYTLLSSTEVPRGYYIDGVDLGAVPRSIALLPDGSFAFVATQAGAVAVDVDPGSESFLQTTLIAVAGGLNELDVTPDGHWIWAVSQPDSAIYLINGVTHLVTAIDAMDEPRGITIGPSGTYAYVPTASGAIQIWNAQEGSLDYKKQIGAMTSSGANLRGKLAIDPKGEHLLALTGTGKLLAFDLGPDTLLTSVSVGSDPRDVIVDPMGQRAYVTDGSGLVTIVSLNGFFKVMDVQTSGSLRGAAMTPAGSYIYAANRELNFLDVVDLVEGSNTYRGVGATIPQGINPVDVDISSDGLYAYSITEQDSKLTVLGIGSGPVIKSLSRRAGRAGTIVVVAGAGFGTHPDSLSVNFPVASGSTIAVTPEDAKERSIVVRVPTGIVSGPISVTRMTPSGGSETSNSVYFELLSGTGAGQQLRLVSQAKLQNAGLGAVATAAMSPLGDQLLYGTEDGRVVCIDTDPKSATFNKEIGETSVGLSAIHDIMVSPDGKRAYVSVPDDQTVDIVNIDRAAPGYPTTLGNISLGVFPPMDTPQELAVSPNGEVLLVQDIATNLLYYVDLVPGRPSENQVVLTMPIVSANEVAFSPSGMRALLALGPEHAVTMVDMDTTSTTFWTRVTTLELPRQMADHIMTPLSLSFFPSGNQCVALAVDDDAYPEHYVYLFDTSYPDTIVYMTSVAYGHTPGTPYPASNWERIDVSPRGDRAVYHQNQSGLFSFDAAELGLGTSRHIGTAFTRQSWMDHDFSIDGSTLYTVGTDGDSLQVYDYDSFATADSLFKVSGDAQAGVAGESLPAALRVQVRSGGIGTSGVPVTFEVASGGGVLTANNTVQNLVGYWALDEASGSNVSDGSGHNLNGTAAGTAIVDGVVGKARAFNGTATDSLKVPDNDLLDITDEITLMLWAKLDPADTDGILLIKRLEHAFVCEINYGVIYSFSPGHNFLSFIFGSGCATGSSYALTDTPGLSDGGWHHLAISFRFGEPASAKWMIDGIERAGAWTQWGGSPGGGTETPPINSYPLTIGGQLSTSPGYAKGSLDQIRIYDRALSESEIMTIYTQEELNAATQVVQTNSGGYAEVNWQLGSSLGTQTVTASVLGVAGSPATFTGEAVADPNSLALELVDLMPADGAPDVAVTTTFLATFSRAVDPATITTASFYLHETGSSTPVPGQFGFTDQLRKVSIATSAPLAFSTSYALEVTSDVEDANAGALDNPAVATFTTAAAPPLALKSVSPPAATADVTLVLGGVGFNSTASQNEVFFNTVQAIPFAGAFDYLKVNVPVGAKTGTIRVYNGADTSNALPFNVLVPTNTAADEVVATVGVATATKGVTINPDGSMAYAVSPESDVVVPIDVVTKTSLQPISVGDYPISIDVHPAGTFAYVPNYNSGTLSIIGTDKNVPAEYHKVVKTVLVGTFPTDVVASPDGNWVYVVNAGSNFSKNLDIIDSDDQSVNHHTVVATVGTAQASKGVTINPDGSRLYVGTNTGYVVLNSGDLSYGVVATVPTGAATKGITINPDGSLLFILTTEGNVKIYNIVPNSLGENDVVATVQGSSATKGITLNPDGTILYLIQEENDVIEVVGIDIQGAIGVIEWDGTVPPFQVVTTFLGSFFAGEDPEAIVFDPTGSGLALVTNSGPQTVTFLNTSFVAIELPSEPITIPAYSTVPSVDLEGFEMKNITGTGVSYAYMISTTGPATLSGGTLSSGETASQTPSAVREILNASPAAAVASSYSEVVGVTPVLAPGDSFAPPPAVLTIPAIRQHVEQSIVYRVSIVGNPSLRKEASRLVIIENPVPVFVSGFSAEALDNGVRLSWDVVSDEDVTGFKIYRAETSSGPAELVNVEGLVPVAERQWMDDHALSNREYDYTLGVVLSDGSEVLSQPVKVKTKALVLALHQNYPNPFNPATTIEFTIPEKQHVRLFVYNVAGQRVAMLVDRVLTEGYKRFTWDGRNSRGEPVSTGVYFYRLQVGEKTFTKKMMLLK